MHSYGNSTAPHHASHHKSIERPLSFSISSLRFDSERTRMDFVLMHRWAYTPARRFWSFGYQTKPLARIFDSVPPRLSTAIECAMGAMQAMYSVATLDTTNAITAGNGAIRSAPESTAVSLSGIAESEDAMWEAQADIGFVRVLFDPHTQHRQHVAANAALAKVAGMHREELLARFAAHEVPLPWTDLDFLRFFVLLLRRGLRAESLTVCGRMVFGSGPAARAVLIRHDMITSFDSAGRTTQVSRPLSARRPPRAFAPSLRSPAVTVRSDPLGRSTRPPTLPRLLTPFPHPRRTSPQLAPPYALRIRISCEVLQSPPLYLSVPPYHTLMCIHPSIHPSMHLPVYD